MTPEDIWKVVSISLEGSNHQIVPVELKDSDSAGTTHIYAAVLNSALVTLSVNLKEVGTHTEISISATTSKDVRLRTQLAVSLPATDPWFMMPGLFYGENRPLGCDRVFPRFERGAERSAELVSDHWSFRADRCSTPAVFAWGDEGGFALLTHETSSAGLTGLGFQHTGGIHKAGVASIHIRFPYREEPVTYYGSADPLPASSTDFILHAGDEITFQCELHSLGTNHHDYAPILRDIHDRWKSSNPIDPWVDVEQASDIASDGLLNWHYNPDPGILLETVGFDRGIGVDGVPVDRQAMHIAWVSGIPWATAMLAHAQRTQNAKELTASTHVIDFACSSLSPSGSFWGVWYKNHGWAGSWTPMKGGVHARTLGEAVLFLTRALLLEDSAGRHHPSWENAIRSNVELMLKRQRPDGNLGSIHHMDTGEVLSWQGAAALIWICAFIELAEAQSQHSDLLNRCLPHGYSALNLVQAAKKAGSYYKSFIADEFIYGAPEDVDLAPTSEDGYNAVMAYVALYRYTKDSQWLNTATNAADWMLTFRYTYNVDFSDRTFLGRYDFHTRGADQASPSNQHLHSYGLVCTKEMDELSKFSGDPFWAQRADETLACFRQLIARNDGDINAYRGMISERYYQTECFQPKGMLLTLSHAWCCGVLLLACEERLGSFGPLGSQQQ
jgi:hypothetical protein